MRASPPVLPKGKHFPFPIRRMPHYMASNSPPLRPARSATVASVTPKRLHKTAQKRRGLVVGCLDLLDLALVVALRTIVFEPFYVLWIHAAHAENRRLDCRGQVVVRLQPPLTSLRSSARRLADRAARRITAMSLFSANTTGLPGSISTLSSG